MKRYTFLHNYILNKYVYKHFSVLDDLRKELQELHIQSSVLPLIIKINERKIIKKKSRIIKVLIYYSEEKKYFYGYNILRDLITRYKDNNNIEFHIIGRNNPLFRYKNLHRYGWVNNMDKIWDKINLYIRLTEHDGLSLLVVEALSRGKQVIWSKKYPYCFYARDIEHVTSIINKFIKEGIKTNIEGYNFVLKSFKPQNIVNKYRQIYDFKN